MRNAWDEVANRFTELGAHVKDRIDANIAFADEDRAKVDDALKQQVQALDTTFTAIGDSMRDPEVRSQLKETATAMGAALTTTFREVGDEIQSKLGRK
jgi:hypothetical protein